MKYLIAIFFIVFGARAADQKLPFSDRQTVLRTAWPQMVSMQNLKTETMDFTDDQKFQLFQLARGDMWRAASDSLSLPKGMQESLPSLKLETWRAIVGWLAKAESNNMVEEDILPQWGKLVKFADLEQETKGFSEGEKYLFMIWLNDKNEALKAYPGIASQKLGKGAEWLNERVNEKMQAQNEAQWSENSMVILLSTKDYKQAKKTAQEASRKLDIKLDLRGLTPHPNLGLTHSKKFCGDDPGYPCYYSRDLEHAGTVSVEHSSMIRGLAPGYYIVVAASGGTEDENVTAVLKQARKYYPDAYAKHFQIWMGCRH